MYGINPDTGDLLWKTQAGDGGVLGGIEWGFATDGMRRLRVALGAIEKKAGEAGGIVAVNVADGTSRWSAPPCGRTRAAGAPAAARPARGRDVIPGVVFSGSLDGHLRAYDSGDRSGAVRRRHGARVPHGERRAGAWRIDQWPRRDGRGRHAVRQLGLRIARASCPETCCSRFRSTAADGATGSRVSPRQRQFCGRPRDQATQ